MKYYQEEHNGFKRSMRVIQMFDVIWSLAFLAFCITAVAVGAWPAAIIPGGCIAALMWQAFRLIPRDIRESRARWQALSDGREALVARYGRDTFA